MEHLSARELYEGTVEGRLLLVTPKDMLRLWKWKFVSIGAPLLGEHGIDAPFLGPLREGINFFI